MAWALEECDRPLRVGERRKKPEELLETKEAELEGALAELTTAQTELAQLKEAFLKYREEASIKVSRL